MPARKSANNAEVEARVAEVCRLMVRGLSRVEIIQKASDDWQVSERTTDTYIARARAYLKEQIDRDRDANFAMAVHRYEDLFKRTMKLQDYKTALSVQKELSAIQNLYPPSRVENTGANGGAIRVMVEYGDPDGHEDSGE